MPTPSLLIVPSRFKSGKLYSQIPTSGAGDFTVTRATSATRVNASGLIEVQKTNLALQSAGFQVSGTWVPENVTITTGTTSAFTAPDGSTDADLLTDNTTLGKHRVSQGSLSFTSGITYAFSVFVKKNSSGRFLLVNANTAFGARAALNLDTLEITNINGSGASVEDYGNGWYRFLVMGTTTSTQTTSVLIQMQDAATDANYIGNGSSFYLWGAQLEVGSSASEYIPTTTVARTRFAGVTVDGTVATNIPRLDYFASGGTVGCPALLVEPSGTNFARFVNQMTAQDTPAASGGMTTTTGSTDFLAPDGTSGSITKYVGGAASGPNQYAYYAGGNIVASASGVHTYSLFVKRGETNPLNFCAISFLLFTGASGTATSYFNLASGTAITAGASIQDYGNGWYRIISAPYTLAASDLSGQIVFNMASTSGSLSFAASGALNLTAYTWGSQLEAGSVATSYIPTTTGSVTRNADVVTVSGAVSGSIGQTEGVLYIECESNFANDDIIAINRNLSNAITIYKGGSNQVIGRVYASGATFSFASSATTGVMKIALAYKSGDSALFLNGAQVGSTNTTALTFSAALNLISMTKASNYLVGVAPTRIRAVALYTTRLTNAELAALTTP